MRTIAIVAIAAAAVLLLVRLTGPSPGRGEPQTAAAGVEAFAARLLDGRYRLDLLPYAGSLSVASSDVLPLADRTFAGGWVEALYRSTADGGAVCWLVAVKGEPTPAAVNWWAEARPGDLIVNRWTGAIRRVTADHPAAGDDWRAEGGALAIVRVAPGG